MLKGLFFGALAAVAIAAAAPQAVAAQVDTFVIVPDNPGHGGPHFHGGNAVTTTSLNVRAGPGTQYHVIDVLYHGQSVRIVTCERNWCWINQRGPSGWVSENHLRRTGGGGGGHVGPPPPPPPPPPSAAPRRGVCFFDQERFRGHSFCASPGESDAHLGWWDNRIRSIRVNGVVTVQVCTDRGFHNCSAFNRDQSSLPRWLSGSISAFRVFH